MRLRFDSEKEYKQWLASRRNTVYPISLQGESKKQEFKLDLKKPVPDMNKTERRYAEKVLDPLLFTKEILAWYFESITFVLAPRTTYTPDFLVIRCNSMEIVEIKGKLEDDASVKYKMARELFPWFNWVMVRLVGNEFKNVRI